MRGNTAIVKKTKPVKILRRGKSAVTDGTVADFFECFTQVDARLRARLGEAADIIETVRGIGYRCKG